MTTRPDEGRPGRTTLADVARHAGVSLATASRALNGSSRVVRDDLARRVAASAEVLDYRVDTGAQAMARGRTNLLGLLVTDIADPYFSSIAHGVMKAAEAQGLVVTIAATHGDPHRELDLVAGLRAQRARALVVVGSRVDAGAAVLDDLRSALAAYQAGGGRVAVVSQARLGTDTVVVRNRAAARRLAVRLVELGYRRFGVLAGGADLLTSRDRVAGFRDGLRGLGSDVAARHVLHTSFTRDGGFDGATAALDQGWDVDCLFAVNDVMAVGAMAALRSRGVRLPGDLAVAGFDDITTLRDVVPALTTVRLPLERIGEDTVALLARDRSQRPRTVQVDGEVVVRESTPGLPVAPG